MSGSGTHARFLWLAKTTADIIAPETPELHPALTRWFLAIYEAFANLIGRGRQ